jgi:DNA (cytosine-5)-methyltransferase 1
LKSGKSKPTFIDLFAGIGGFRIGMEHAGFKNVFSNDYDKYASQTYEAWFGSDNHICQSVLDEGILDQIPKHDVLCGGFPCQPFSNAGKKLGFKDNKQGNLFFRIAEIAAVKRPKVIFLENVRTLLNHDNKETFKTIIREMNKLGYEGAYQIINSKYWVPQNRVRIYMVFFDVNKTHLNKIHAFDQELLAIKEGGGKSIKAFSSIKDTKPDKSAQIPEGTWESLKLHKARNKAAGRGFGFKLVTDFSKPTNTLSARYAKDGAEILIEEGWKRPRKITLTEAKNLMGFNDLYAKTYNHPNGFPIICSNAQSYKQLGNAAIPEIIEDIGTLIAKYI